MEVKDASVDEMRSLVVSLFFLQALDLYTTKRLKGCKHMAPNILRLFQGPSPKPRHCSPVPYPDVNDVPALQGWAVPHSDGP
jgi:hypothetical protein